MSGLFCRLQIRRETVAIVYLEGTKLPDRCFGRKRKGLTGGKDDDQKNIKVFFLCPASEPAGSAWIVKPIGNTTLGDGMGPCVEWCGMSLR